MDWLLDHLVRAGVYFVFILGIFLCGYFVGSLIYSIWFLLSTLAGFVS